MKLLKAIMTGVLSIALLSVPVSGFSFDSGIQKVEASTQVKAMYAKKQVSAYKSRSSKSGRIMTIPYGVRIDRLATQSSWSQVRYKGKIGWVASRDLVEIKKTEVLDTKKVVTLYASRSTKAKTVTKVPANKQVTRLATNKSWSQVKYGGKTGWTASSSLKLRYTKETFALKKYRVKEGAPAPLQSSYSTGSEVIATLPDFGVVESVERYNNWYKVTFDKKTGWVEAKYLTTYKKESTYEALKRIYGSSYDISYDPYDSQVFKSIDGESIELYYRDGYVTLSYSIDHLNQNVAREEYNKAAKFITAIHGGDPNKLSAIMWDAMYNGHKYEDKDLKYDKYTTYQIDQNLAVTW